jgi:hypothetical protein
MNQSGISAPQSSGIVDARPSPRRR